MIEKLTVRVAELERQLAPVLASTARDLVFDLRDLKFISSAGLRVFSNARKQVKERGGQASFIHLQPQIQEVFEIIRALPGVAVFENTAELDRYLSSRDVHVWTLNVRGETAGYFELQRHPDDTVEVMYFGLVESFIGRGLGGWLLTRAVEEAFALGARRVILNTCTLDSPRALPNYLARGFVIVREDRYVTSVPSRTHLTLGRTAEPA